MGRIKWHGSCDAKRQSPLAKHIGSQLLRAREKHQLTIRETAKRVGISNAFVCQIENGQSVPGAEILWKLSRTFDVPVTYWFRGFTDDNG